MTENARTQEAAKHLEERAFGAVGALMFESHRSLRDDFEVSCRELDTLVDIAAELLHGGDGPVFGARMTGGGFGGCTVTLVRTRQVEVVAATLAREYERLTGGHLTHFVSHPARGAHQLSVAAVSGGGAS